MSNDYYNYEDESDSHWLRNVSIIGAFALGTWAAYKLIRDPEKARELGRKVKSGVSTVKEKVSDWAQTAMEKTGMAGGADVEQEVGQGVGAYDDAKNMNPVS